MAAPHKIGKRTERRLNEIENTLVQLQEKLDRLITVFEGVMMAEGAKDSTDSTEDAAKGKGKPKSKKEDAEIVTE